LCGQHHLAMTVKMTCPDAYEEVTLIPVIAPYPQENSTWSKARGGLRLLGLGKLRPTTLALLGATDRDHSCRLRGPRIDDIDTAVLKIPYISRGEARPSRTSHGGYHGVELADALPHQTVTEQGPLPYRNCYQKGVATRGDYREDT
jgi:hypothetical protein